ncbi:MAG: chemotaxis protein CheB, partial [Pseudomonadota bacterium]
QEGARETLEALEAGAIDFLPKERDMLTDAVTSGASIDHLLSCVRAVGRSQLRIVTSDFRANIQHASRRISTVPADRFKLLAIGTSTGGPVAVQAILSRLPRHFPLPIVVAVHMPAGFTAAYAERLNSISQIEVREAMDLDPLRPGLALIAPGGKQLHVENGASGPLVRIRRALPGDVYHPSVDQLFLSSARTLGNQVLGLVLTGMGSDGLEGSRLLKSADAQIWSQDKKSCVVYGMPQAVEKAGLSNQVLAVDEIAAQLIRQL